MRKIRFPIMLIAFFLLLSLAAWAGTTNLDSLVTTPTSDDTYAISTKNSSGTTVYSVDPYGNVLGGAFGGGVGTTHVFVTNAPWTLSTAEAANLLLIASSGSSTVYIVPPTTVTGRIYFVRNTSGQSAIIWASGKTGVTIATAKTAGVIFNGTDYIRLTPDATN